jgi:hypothetical protein
VSGKRRSLKAEQGLEKPFQKFIVHHSHFIVSMVLTPDSKTHRLSTTGTLKPKKTALYNKLPNMVL